jgi:hypothetical protein
VALVALAPLTLPMPRPLPLPLADGSLIVNGRARPDACSSAALATISALSASLVARVRLRAGSSTTISFPFLFSRPISITESNKDAALRATASKKVRAKHRTLGVRGVDARVCCKVRGRRHGGGAKCAGDGVDGSDGGTVTRGRRCGGDGGAVAHGCRRSGARADGGAVARGRQTAAARKVCRRHAGGGRRRVRAAQGGAVAEATAKAKGRQKMKNEQAAASGQESYMTSGPRGFSYRRLIRRLGFERRLITSV